MRTLLVPLCAALMAAVVPAQVSSMDVIVAEGAASFPATSTGLTLVNPTTGKSRAVGGHKVGPFMKVALNTQNAADLWGLATHICVGFGTPLDYFKMTGDKITTTSLGCVDFGLSFNRLNWLHSYHNELLFSMSGNTGGLYSRPRGANKSTQLVSANANHIAVLGERIYLSTTDSPNLILEVDFNATPKVKALKLILDPNATTGSKLPTTISAMCNNGPAASADSLAVFDNKGVLYIVKPGVASPAHNVTTNNRPGIATPIKAVYHPKAATGLIVATSTKLYDGIQYILPQGKPFYTTGNKQINDIAYHPGGVFFYGKGCKGTNGKTPEMVFGGLPYQGNQSYQIRMKNGKPSSLARLVIGFSKTTWAGKPLPRDLVFLGAGGCNLLASVDLMLTVGTDQKGEINLPQKVPVDSKIVGATVYLQCVVADKANAAGLVTSNAMQLVVR